MNGNILTVFKKELLDTLRDRKTLAFMLLIPTLVTPVLMISASRVVESVARKKAVERVTIVASSESQQHYTGIVHRWFTEANSDPMFRFAFVPALAMMLSQGEAEIETSPEIYSDPEAFEGWIREIGGYATESLSNTDLRERLKDIKLPESSGAPAGGLDLGSSRETMQLLLDFYFVGMRGLAFVDFKDTTTIGPAPPDFNTENIPSEILELPGGRDIAAAIKGKQAQGWLDFPGDPVEALKDSSKTFEPTFWYDSTLSSSGEAEKRVSRVLSQTGELVVKSRLRERSLSPAFLKPLALVPERNLASRSQVVLAAIGGFLPYLVIVYAFLGALYPAIDLGAGEKERNTLETLLLSPISRTEIALGKFFVILLTSLVSALLGILSIGLSFYYMMPAAVMSQINLKIDPLTGIAVSLLALPPAAAIAGIFLAISIYARSFKEAQNYIAPIQFLIILPPMVAMIPGIEMNWKLAMVPLVNVGMLAKDFLKGDVNWLYYLMTIISTLLLAAACIAYSVWQFRREEVLFRS